MAKWMRNVATQAMTTTARGSHLTALLFSEILKVLGFSATHTGSAWTANYVVQEAGGGGVGTGFQVDATQPRIIYDTQGRFTQAMEDTGMVISLFGGLLNDDKNQSMWKIVEYIDANNVRVDAASFNPFGWTTDTQLGGNIIDFDQQILSNGNFSTFDAPTAMGRYRIRITYTNSGQLDLDIAPMFNTLVGTGNGTTDGIAGAASTWTVTVAALIGKLNKHMPGTNVTIAGATNPGDNGTFLITAINNTTGAITYTNASGVGESGFSGTATVAGISTYTNKIDFGDNVNMRNVRLNMYADDDVVHVYYTSRVVASPATYPYAFWSFGRLANVASGDSDPIFLFAEDYQVATVYYPWDTEIRMLDGAVTPADVRAYMCWWCEDTIVGDDDCFPNIFLRRLVNGSPGKLILIEPNIILNDVPDGGCLRGTFPKFGLGYIDLDKLRPLDAAGSWVHFNYGHYYPRNGPNDPLPKITEWD